jgi:transcriptional regulator with XRE-family HTH domain
MKLGKVLREARNRRGLSLRDVEREVRISNGHLSLIESGQVRQPSPRYLQSLADLYGVSFALLMELAGHVAPSRTPLASAAGDADFSDLSEIEREQVRAFASFLKASRKNEDYDAEGVGGDRRRRP